LRSNSCLGIAELAIYHAQLFQVETKPAFLFEQEFFQGCPYGWIALPSDLIHEFFDVMGTDTLGHRVHGEPFS
jgi:hypothetical protein